MRAGVSASPECLLQRGRRDALDDSRPGLAGPSVGKTTCREVAEDAPMFEAIFVLVSFGILVVEIIEVRHKCEALPAGLSDGSSFAWAMASVTGESRD
jgi:hypothetical protein